MATTLSDLSPAAALRSAYQRANLLANAPVFRGQTAAPPQPVPREDQYLADWHIACEYGLFTSENLARLQAGLPPVATDGPFAGQTIQAKKIGHSGRFLSVGDFALGPENGALALDAVLPARRPDVPNGAPVYPPPQTYVPAQRPGTPPPGYRRDPLGRDYPTTTTRSHAMPMPPWQQPSAPTLAPTDATAHAEPPRVLLQDLPFNGLLPMDGKVKLGIAGVTASEISVSIVGERQVKVPYPNGGYMFNPSVDNYKVPRINPVRLPGISNDAYLIKDDHTSRSGGEVRYYYIDVSVNNGTTFRIAKVLGDF